MRIRYSNIVFSVVISLSANIVVKAQTQGAIPGKGITLKPTIYSTTPKNFIAQLRGDGQGVFDISGNISFTVTAANPNDTVTGTVNFTIPDEARQKIAAHSGNPLSAVPSIIMRKDVIASFEPATAPPIIHLLISSLEIGVSGVNVYFSRIMLDINARQLGPTISTYTTEEIEVLFTLWARQIVDSRPRRGIISRLNKVIAGI